MASAGKDYADGNNNKSPPFVVLANKDAAPADGSGRKFRRRGFWCHAKTCWKNKYFSPCQITTLVIFYVRKNSGARYLAYSQEPAWVIGFLPNIPRLAAICGCVPAAVVISLRVPTGPYGHHPVTSAASFNCVHIPYLRDNKPRRDLRETGQSEFFIGCID